MSIGGSEIWPILLGGAISLAGAVAVSVLQKSWEQSEFRKRKLEKDSADAFALLTKLVEIHAWNSSVKRALDESFSEFSDPNVEPGVKVRPLVGNPGVPSKLSSEEMALVLRTGDGGLLEKLLNFQGNFLVSVALVSEFNRKREIYSDFISENAVHQSMDSGESARALLPREVGPRHDLLLATLNNMIGDIVQATEDGVEESRQLITRLQTALKTLPGLEVIRVGFQE